MSSQIFWGEKGTTSKTKLLSFDKDNCIYKHEIKEEADSLIVCTGCEGEEKDMQVIQKNHPPFYGKVKRDGTVEEIKMPPVKDIMLFPKDNDRENKKGLRNWTDRLFRRGGAINSKLELPKCMEMEVYLYYGPSFEQLVGKAAEIRAKRIASHAEAQFLHPEFGTKLFVRTVVKKLHRDAHLLREVLFLVPTKYLKKGRLHTFLVDGSIGHHSPSPGTNGIAWGGTVCGKNLKCG